MTKLMTAAQLGGAHMIDPEFPPRGSGFPERVEGQPAAVWGHPWNLSPAWDWKPGKILLGQWDGRLLGDPDQKEMNCLGDDRHLMTIAGSRAGKSRTVLIPNLLRYPGSVIVIDPKGELARLTASARAEKFGQNVFVLDPFGTSGFESYAYNPLDELNPRSNTFIDDIGLVASSLIVAAKGGGAHWTEAARNLVTGILLYMYASGGECSLSRMRRILMSEDASVSFGDSQGDGSSLFHLMAGMDDFGGLVARIGKSFLEKSDREGSSIVSTAREQLSFLDSIPMADVLASSPLRLGNIKRQASTIYLCLPAARLATHARWLRLVVTLALVELEKDQTSPKHPVLLMLEEFAALQRLEVIERAAGFIAGSGVRLWTILQDLSQLQVQYDKSWETFIGNTGSFRSSATWTS